MRMACGIACSPARMNCDQFTARPWSRNASCRSRSTVAFDRAEFGGYAGVEDAYPLLAQEREQFGSFFVADDELDRHGHVGRELEEMLFVEDAVPTEAGDCAECRPAVDAHLLRLLEQPFEQGDVTVRAVLVHIEAKQRASHDPLHV